MSKGLMERRSAQTPRGAATRSRAPHARLDSRARVVLTAYINVNATCSPGAAARCGAVDPYRGPTGTPHAHVTKGPASPMGGIATPGSLRAGARS
jgi:hypothetical protein